MLSIIVASHSRFLSVKVFSDQPIKIYSIFLIHNRVIAMTPQLNAIDGITEYTIFYEASRDMGDDLVICYGYANKVYSDMKTAMHHIALFGTRELDITQLAKYGWNKYDLSFTPYCSAGFTDIGNLKVSLSGDMIISDNVCYSVRPLKSDLMMDRSALLIKLGRLQEQMLNLEEMDLPALIPRVKDEITFLQQQLQLTILE